MVKMYYIILLVLLLSVLFLGSNGDEECGKVKPCLKQPCIVNGTQSNDGEFIWMVQIIFNNRHQCGGSIISSKWVLSAAHCFFGFYKKNNLESFAFLIRRWGISFADAVNNPKHRIQVEKIIIHPQYDSNPFIIANDVALLQAKTELSLDNVNIGRICLPFIHISFIEGLEMLTAGWGKYVPDKPTDTNQKLMKLKSSYLPSQKCQPRVSPRKWHKSFLCTIPPKYAGWCNGDSGGPVFRQVNGRYVQVGVTSFITATCGHPNVTDVAVSVTFFLDWIQTNTGINFDYKDKLKTPPYQNTPKTTTKSTSTITPKSTKSTTSSEIMTTKPGNKKNSSSALQFLSKFKIFIIVFMSVRFWN